MNTASMSNYLSHSRSNPLNSNKSKINLNFLCVAVIEDYRAVLMIQNSKNTTKFIPQIN